MLVENIKNFSRQVDEFWKIDKLSLFALFRNADIYCTVDAEAS